MTPADTNRVKLCKACGHYFRRPDNGMRERDWLRKVYCNAECRSTDAARNEAPQVAVGDPLLRALVVYGLRNNRDLGMGRESFMERARELGLAA
jgi:hypothetical protein